jgi:hypothetical protein
VVEKYKIIFELYGCQMNARIVLPSLLCPPPAPFITPTLDRQKLKRAFFTQPVDYKQYHENTGYDFRRNIKRRRPNITPSNANLKCKIVDEPAQLIESDEYDPENAIIIKPTPKKEKNFRIRGHFKKTVPLLVGSDSKQYPDTWDKACWWDHQTFTTKPVGMPVFNDFEQNKYVLHGYFCSWNCARAYAEVYTSGWRRGFIGLWIMAIIKALAKAAGEKIDWASFKIPPAPHFSIMSPYTEGGCTLEEFRSLHCQNKRVETIPAHMHLIPSGINVFEMPYAPSEDDSMDTRDETALCKISAGSCKTDLTPKPTCSLDTCKEALKELEKKKPEKKKEEKKKDKPKEKEKPKPKKPRSSRVSSKKQKEPKREKKEREKSTQNGAGFEQNEFKLKANPKEPAKQLYWMKKHHKEACKEFQAHCTQQAQSESTLRKVMNITSKRRR